jgi:hypothetical protein
LWRGLFRAPPGPAAAPAAGIERLTRDGFAVSGPRVIQRRSPSGGREDTVFYSSQGPHRFPDIRAVSRAGGPSSRVVSRFDGETVSSDGRWLYFDQIEFDGPVAMVADLYALDLESGRQRRLSRGARLTDPDVDPSGGRLAAIRARGGEWRVTVLSLRRAADGTPSLADAPELELGTASCRYASPRWSPDAALIAAVRHCAGALPEVVVLAPATGDERVLASGARNLTPAWSADGGTVLFASDREGGRFKLFAAVRPGAQAAQNQAALVLDAPGGVLWPDVSADGTTVVFTSLTADGYDVFSARLQRDAPARDASAGPQPGAAGGAPAGRLASEPDGPDADIAGAPRYSPARSLLPKAWSPVLRVDGDEIDLGASVGGSDVLGYHEYSATASWQVSGPAAGVAFDGPPLGVSVAYAYQRWRPSWLLSAWQTVDTVSVAGSSSPAVWTSQERSRGLFAGVLLPWRRVRIAQNWLAGVEVDERSYPEDSGIPDRARNAVRAGWAVNTSREYGYSISPEEGVRVTVNAERVTSSLGADGDAFTLAADARGYVPGFAPHHVVALRAAAAGGGGDEAMRRVFRLGGNGAPAAAFQLGQDAIGLVRGLPPADRAGEAAAVANLDYRFPLVRVERGVRTWPVFLRDVHGAIFCDVGSAGGSLGTLPPAAVSAGGELAARFTLGYGWNVSLAAGAAWTHDPARPDRPDRFAAFLRTGYAF